MNAGRPPLVQDLPGRRLDRGVGGADLAVDAAVDLRGRGVVDVDVARGAVGALEGGVGAGGDGLGAQGRGLPRREHLARHDAAQVGLERDHVDGVALRRARRRRRRAQRAAVAALPGRGHQGHRLPTGRQLCLAGQGAPSAPAAAAGLVADGAAAPARGRDDAPLDGAGRLVERQGAAGAQAADPQPRTVDHDEVGRGVGAEQHAHGAAGAARGQAGVVERQDLLVARPAQGAGLGAVLRHPVAVAEAVGHELHGGGPGRPAAGRWRAGRRPPRPPGRSGRPARTRSVDARAGQPLNEGCDWALNADSLLRAALRAHGVVTLKTSRPRVMSLE